MEAGAFHKVNESHAGSDYAIMTHVPQTLFSILPLGHAVGKAQFSAAALPDYPAGPAGPVTVTLPPRERYWRAHSFSQSIHSLWARVVFVISPPPNVTHNARPTLANLGAAGRVATIREY